MSMLNLYYGNQMIQVQPEWMKKERLEYCEPIVLEKSHRRIPLVQLFLSIFA